MKRMVSALLVCMTIVSYTSAQRIVGFFPNYAYNSTAAQNIQYAKLTHLNYFSLNPKRITTGVTDGSLWTNDPHSWFSTTRFNDVLTKARAANPNIKIFIATGGAPGNDTDLNTRFIYIANNACVLNTFCNNIISFIKTNNLDGWDLDWEFPNTNDARNAHETLLSKMRQKFDSLNTADSKSLEISIDVGGGFASATCWNPNHLQYANASVINYVDYVNIMVYDGPEGSNSCQHSSHEHYDLLIEAFTGWTNTKGWPASKMVAGVSFQDNDGNRFSSGGNNSTYYNQEYWNGGSGCPNMQKKINYVKENGGAGIFIWEVTQDNLCSGTAPSCYSLLDCIYQYATTNCGSWTTTSPCSTPTGLLSSEKTTALSVFPNPFKESFRVSDLKLKGTAQLSVYNAWGEKVAQTKLMNADDEVVFDNKLTKGIYFIEIVSEGYKYSAKVIKE